MVSAARGQVSKVDDVELPAAKPYLNVKKRFVLGNGIMFAVGDANGAWTRLAGPGYTIPRGNDGILNKNDDKGPEGFVLDVDGVAQPLTMDMHRAEKTGIYYGTTVRGDLRVCLVDEAPWDKPCIFRLLQIENLSPTTSHQVQVSAFVETLQRPRDGVWTVLKDAGGTDSGLSIKLDSLFNLSNKTPLSIVVALSDPTSTVVHTNWGHWRLDSKATIPAGGSYRVALNHYGYVSDGDDASALKAIRETDYVKELGDGIHTWQAWYDGVGDAYKLDKITDPRGRDLVEGGLAILKSNESKDGGLIAHSTFYTEGYTRDAALGLRGFSATGHFDELRRWLLWMESKYETIHCIPNSTPCFLSLDDKAAGGDIYNVLMESPALVVLTARDYYQATHDLQTLTAIHPCLQYCIDEQLKFATENNERMNFNGDETELCGAAKNIYGSGVRVGRGSGADWSMTSVALCAAALDFYIQYLGKKGDDPAAYQNTESHTVMNLPVELDKLETAMDRDYWRTDVPQAPDGFHDSFRPKADNSWPLKPITDFTLFPVYFGTPYKELDRRAKDVAAMYAYFNPSTGYFPLVPADPPGFDGHTLAYLLWGLADVGDPRATQVYQALVSGPIPDCWGGVAEAYDAKGPNTHDLRSLETGCTVSALAEYWKLGASNR